MHDNEEIIEDFVFIIACNTIHTGKGMKAAPKAKLDDGLIDVVMVNKDANRLQLLKLLSRLSDGSHIQSEYVHYKQAKNIQLIPGINEGVNIDGDVKYNTPVSISVLQKKLPIFYINSY